MQKWAPSLTIIFTAALFLISSSYAQPYFGGINSTVPTKSTVMSSEDFKSMVTSLGQQNQQSLSQQLGQQMKKPPIESSTTTPPPSGTNVIDTNTASAPTTPPVTQLNPPPPASGTAQTTAAPTALPATQAPAPIRPQEPIYTGFGSSNSGVQNAPANRSGSTGDNSDGFRINY